MRKLRTLCAYLIGSLGLVHVALTGYATGHWRTPRALFFLGTGVAILLIAGVNLILNRADDDARVRALGIAANGMAVA